MTPKRLAILCNTAPPGERPQYEQMEWDYDNEPDALTFYDPTDVENLIDEVEALQADNAHWQDRALGMQTERDALRVERDAWKHEAEQQYLSVRQLRCGDQTDYPVEGALSAKVQNSIDAALAAQEKP